MMDRKPPDLDPEDQDPPGGPGADRRDDKAARERRWLEENREALDSSNAWVEANGLPLAKYRLF